MVRGLTVSHEAAELLAGLPPWDLETTSLHTCTFYEWRCNAGATLRCRDKSRHPDVMAVITLFEEWLERYHSVLIFFMTQIFTGYGKDGRSLHLIREEETPAIERSTQW
ncbi:hypothetical protein PYW07_010763 [Mythimna separata]|uniref:Uncharacterized protein n=1 Tax=Mythimna separata TaxID=271217 RepID=A0AAD7Y7Z0_MYTSE|nr:hypothetical protein PYW07_010763 [Mythimna separata]